MRAFAAKLLCMVACLGQMACAVPYGSTSSDTIQGFFFEPGSSQVLVVGSRYHYFLEMQKDLKAILEWPGRQKMQVAFGLFTVSPSNEIAGSYEMRIEEAALSPSDVAFLRRNYFFPKQGVLVRYATIKGVRYDGRNMTLPKLIPFSRPYTIGVREAQSIHEPPPTPVVLQAGAAVVGGAVLIPVCLIGSLVQGRCQLFPF